MSLLSMCVKDFLPLLYISFTGEFLIVIFFFLGVSFSFLSKEVPLEYVAKLFW